jgi:hypothetical protein
MAVTEAFDGSSRANGGSVNSTVEQICFEISVKTVVSQSLAFESAISQSTQMPADYLRVKFGEDSPGIEEPEIDIQLAQSYFLEFRHLRRGEVSFCTGRYATGALSRDAGAHR